VAEIAAFNFELADYQRDLVDATRQFLAARAPLASARLLMTGEPGFDPAVQRQLGSELGLLGLHVPEEHGGAGAGFTEVSLALQETGRVLYPGPYLPAIIALELLLQAGDAGALARLGPQLADGAATAAVAWAEAAGPGRIDQISVTASQADGGWAISGSKRFVINGDTADILLVSARTADGPSLFAVTGDASGLTRTRRPTLDQTRALADLDFDAAPAELIGTAGGAAGPLAAAFDRACAALAAETIGVADATLEVTLAYLKERRQFGRAIGSFQALKHRCADLLLAIELARCAVEYAARAIDAGADDVTAAAAIALSEASLAAQHVAGECIQMHGGIGFTWEHDAHLFFKRARASAALLGSVAEHRERLLQSIGV
jgi:alkylation response protein AidB-like acyl-CoA dehydrogenase